MQRWAMTTLLVLLAGCSNGPAPPQDSSRGKTPDSPGAGDASGRVVVSGWSIEDPIVTPRDKDFEDNDIEIRETPTLTHPFTIKPKAGNRLVVWEGKVTPVAEDPKAIEMLIARRKDVFNNGDETFQFLSGDGSLSPEQRKNLARKYRLFDMEKIVLTGPPGTSYKPRWCIAPEAEFTFIFAPGVEGDYLEKWMNRNPEMLTAAGRLAVRTNANRFMKTDGSFACLMEVDQTVAVSLLYEIPQSVQLESLQVVVDGGAPVAMKGKK